MEIWKWIHLGGGNYALIFRLSFTWDWKKLGDVRRCYRYRMRSGEMKTGKVYVTNAVMRLRYAERTAFASTWIRDRLVCRSWMQMGNFQVEKIYHRDTLWWSKDLGFWDFITKYIWRGVILPRDIPSFTNNSIGLVPSAKADWNNCSSQWTVKLLFRTFHFFSFFVII